MTRLPSILTIGLPLGLVAAVVAMILDYGPSSTAKTQAQVTQVPVEAIVKSVAGKDIYLINLEDGTRCAVISGLQSGGIDCDWQSANQNEHPKSKRHTE